MQNAAFFGITILSDGAVAEDGLWEAHLPAWQAWCAISGQWRTVVLTSEAGAKVIWLGIDYAAARAGLDLAGIAVTPDCWSEVRVIEEGAIEELNRSGR